MLRSTGSRRPPVGHWTEKREKFARPADAGAVRRAPVPCRALSLPVSAPSPRTPDDPPPFPPFGVHSVERVYDSHWCALRRDMVVLRNGQLQEYHVFEIPDAVVVVPVLGDGSIVMIGQYRYPHGKTHWEVPAGRISPGESAEDAARRELREESGCSGGRLVELPGFYPTNGISPHFVRAFAALDCELTHELELDDAEQIVVKRFTRDEVRALLRAGRFADAFTALTLLYYFELLDSPASRPC